MEWINTLHSMPEDGDYLVWWDDGSCSMHPFRCEEPMSGWYEPLAGCMITHFLEIVPPKLEQSE